MSACASLRVISPTSARKRCLHWKANDVRFNSRLHALDQKLITPHSGYHWDGTDGRFFEGWYFKVEPSVRAPFSVELRFQVMIPKDKDSFALIYSVEDPKGNSSSSGIGAQIMGPQDGYMVQYDYDVSKFWASTSSLMLGACFETKSGKPRSKRLISDRKSVV